MQPTELLLHNARPRLPPQGGRAACSEERRFATLSRGLHHHGGLATGDEMALWLRHRAEQPVSTLARWIVDRHIVQVAWHGTTLLPWFQFDPECMLPRPIVIEIVGELRDAYDDEEIALWFVTPNVATNRDAPVDVLAKRPADVLAAARMDRFVAVGLG